MHGRFPIRPLLVLLALLGATAAVGARRDAGPLDAPAVPPVPTSTALRAQGLGDGQFAFRARSLQLQHLGNLGGRVVPYKDMDYARLERWFRTLDRLDDRAIVVPVTAAFLYSNTQRAADVRHLVAYLADRARARPATGWRWMAHAIYLARYRLEDPDLALRLAGELRRFEGEDIPPWARQLEIFVLRDIGRKDAARALVLGMLEDGAKLPPAERRWLRFYLERELR